MNDIERLIAGLPRPSPSADLDARIATLTSAARGDDHTAPNRNRAAVRRLLVAIASTAGAGLLGFAIGRYSATPAVGGQLAMQSAATLPTMTDQTGKVPTGASDVQVSSPVPARDRTIVKIEVPESEALVRFIMPSKRFTGLFGDAALEERSEDSQFE
jgi:hypothetical protein